jgi:hypothetical protein
MPPQRRVASAHRSSEPTVQETEERREATAREERKRRRERAKATEGGEQHQRLGRCSWKKAACSAPLVLLMKTMKMKMLGGVAGTRQSICRPAWPQTQQSQGSRMTRRTQGGQREKIGTKMQANRSCALPLQLFSDRTRGPVTGTSRSSCLPPYFLAYADHQIKSQNRWIYTRGRPVVLSCSQSFGNCIFKCGQCCDAMSAKFNSVETQRDSQEQPPLGDLHNMSYNHKVNLQNSFAILKRELFADSTASFIKRSQCFFLGLTCLCLQLQQS